MVGSNMQLVCSPSEFVDTVAHVRVLSWVLLGALHATGTPPNMPSIPIDASQQIADQIQFVLAGFAEQSKVGHMLAFSFPSSLVGHDRAGQLELTVLTNHIHLSN